MSYTGDPSMKVHTGIVLYRNGTVTTLSWPAAASLLLGNLTAF